MTFVAFLIKQSKNFLKNFIHFSFGKHFIKGKMMKLLYSLLVAYPLIWWFRLWLECSYFECSLYDNDKDQEAEHKEHCKNIRDMLTNAMVLAIFFVLLVIYLIYPQEFIAFNRDPYEVNQQLEDILDAVNRNNLEFDEENIEEDLFEEQQERRLSPRMSKKQATCTFLYYTIWLNVSNYLIGMKWKDYILANVPNVGLFLLFWIYILYRELF